MHRFFVPPEAIVGNAVVFQCSIRHQLKNVLRLANGDHIIVQDNSGWEYQVVLTDMNIVTGEIVDKTYSQAEPHTKVTLFQALLKGAKFELVLQKATELGVTAFVPIVCQRCVATGHLSSTKISRWQQIIKEASEQAGRAMMPPLYPVQTLAQACSQGSSSQILFHVCHYRS